MKTTSEVLFAAIALTAATLPAQQLPPARPLAPALATSTEPLASVTQVRALPGGRVIVHDLAGRRVLVFDSTLTKFTVIADTTSATGNAYGSRLGGLVAYRGDSTLFVDPVSVSMLVIDGSGKIVRTMAAPLPKEVNQLIGGPNGTPGFDPTGRLVYRAQQQMLLPNVGRGGAGDFQMPPRPESSLVVRVDLKTRKVDTAATFRIPKVNLNMTRDDNGRVTVTTTVNPIPWTDDWAMLSDGRVAIVRGQDYRVDFVGLDGKVTSGPKIPFDWQRLTDDDKAAIIDSTKGQLEKMRAAQLAAVEAANPNIKANTDTSKSGRQRPAADGGGNMTIMIGGRGGDGGAPGPMPVGFTLPPLSFVTPAEMPDYRPVFRQGATRADEDGNLWIRTSHVVSGATEYDVISGTGELKERVLVPPGRVIAGFGRGGVVYMGVSDGFVAHLERARLQ